MARRKNTQLTVYENKEEMSDEQVYFDRASKFGNLISPLSGGLNVNPTIDQRYAGLQAPVSSFYNPVIDDLQRDFFWSFYLWKFGLTDTPPEGREINRQLLEWVLSDPGFERRRFLTVNAQISAAAGANKLCEELLKDQDMKSGMKSMGNAEEMEDQADDLEEQADQQENGGEDEDQNPDGNNDDQQDSNQDSDNEGDGEDEDQNSDGGSDGDSETDDEGGDTNQDQQGGFGDQEPETSPEQKRQQADKLRRQAERERERGQEQIEKMLNGRMQSMIRAGAVGKAEQFAGEVGAFLSGWGIEQGEGLNLSIDELRAVMKMMTQKGLANLTSLMGRAYGIALSVLKGRNPVEIMVDTGGLTKNIHDIAIDQLAMLSTGVPKEIRNDYMMKFMRSGLPGVTRTTQAKQEGAFIWRNDNSGSMSSGMPVNVNDPNSDYVSRLTVANALVLGIAKAAKENGQMFNLASFGSHGEVTTPVTEASPLSEILRFAEGGFGGGTDFDYALGNAMDVFDALDEEDKFSADLGMSTDGEAEVSETTMERLYYLKETYGMRLHVLLIGGAGYGSIEEVADNLLEFKSMDGIAEILAKAMWAEK